MKTNMKLKQLLNSLGCEENSEKSVVIKLKNLEKMFNPSFELLRDCIVLAGNVTHLDELDLNKLFKILNDKTGFEASTNEVRINDYFDNELTLNEALLVSLLLINIWSLKLKAIDNNASFCFIVGCDSSYVTLRFYKVRGDEPSWLSENLEEFDQPVGFVII